VKDILPISIEEYSLIPTVVIWLLAVAVLEMLKVY
jgi:hypothetical protein